jgi:hypothetical protein
MFWVGFIILLYFLSHQQNCSPGPGRRGLYSWAFTLACFDPAALLATNRAIFNAPGFSLRDWPVGHLLVAGFAVIFALARFSRREVSRAFWADQMIPYCLVYAPLIFILAMALTGGQAVWPWRLPDFIRFK